MTLGGITTLEGSTESGYLSCDSTQRLARLAPFHLHAPSHIPSLIPGLQKEPQNCHSPEQLRARSLAGHQFGSNKLRKCFRWFGCFLHHHPVMLVLCVHLARWIGPNYLIELNLGVAVKVICRCGYYLQSGDFE